MGKFRVVGAQFRGRAGPKDLRSQWGRHLERVNNTRSVYAEFESQRHSHERSIQPAKVLV